MPNNAIAGLPFASLSRPVESLAVGLIGLYQRLISPHKGFRCAYGAAHGSGGCSSFGARAFGRFRVGKALSLIERRLQRCRESYRALVASRSPAEQGSSSRPPLAKACDRACNRNSCDPTPLADCDRLSPGSCNGLDAADLPCDCSL